MDWKPIAELPKPEWKEKWFYDADGHEIREIFGENIIGIGDYLFSVYRGKEDIMASIVRGEIGIDIEKNHFPVKHNGCRYEKLQDVTHFCEIIVPNEVLYGR